MLDKFQHEMTFLKVIAKKMDAPKMLLLKIFWSALFCHDFHKCHFVLKFVKHTKRLSKFITKKF